MSLRHKDYVQAKTLLSEYGKNVVFKMFCLAKSGTAINFMVLG